MKAIETTGHIRKKGLLELDNDFSFQSEKTIRVILLIPEDDDISEDEWLRTAATNPSFQFLNEPEEDIYTIKDGKAVKK